MTCSAYDTSASTGGQMAYNPLPAVAIGGPPHSGKSVLVYSLTQALRALDVDHYVIRAYPPDGEGDWFLEGDPETVRSFRRKGAGSEAWLAPLVRDIARRHLPLVVDLGGMPTPDQEAALDVCTHAILLVRQCMTGGALARDVAAHRVWSQRFGRHGLVLLADLDSVLDGVSVLEGDAPIITGTLAGLERGTRAEGPVLAALVSRLAGLFRAASAGLARHHLATAPVELAIDLAALARTLAIHPLAWPSEVLPRVLAYLPEGEPLAVYGRGPNWLYAAIAAHAFPAPFYLFDVRCGWVRAPDLAAGVPDAGAPVTVVVTDRDGTARLDIGLRDAYVDRAEVQGLHVPDIAAPTVILCGKLPQWLWASLARAYAGYRVAVVQPQIGGAVVVRDPVLHRIGSRLPL